jgi:hypothetical protein
MKTSQELPLQLLCKLCLVTFLLVHCSMMVQAQIITASRALVPPAADDIRYVTDWGDSVYAVTGSGVVVAFDTLFTSSRTLNELSSLRASRLWVFDGDLFIEDPAVGVYVCHRNGKRQFLVLSNSNVQLKIGFNYSMQPIFVTEEGTLTIDRNSEGLWDVVRHVIQVPYFQDIGQLAFTQSCVFVVRNARRAEIYQLGGGIDTAAIVLGSNQILHLIDDTTHVLTQPGPIIIGDNLCSRSNVYYGLRYEDDSLLTMNGATVRTTSNAPFVMFHGDYRKGTSQMIVWRSKRDLDTSHNALIPERQWRASTTDRAIYVFGPDGWIRRVSLTTRSVSIRRTVLCDGCSIVKGHPSLYSKQNSFSILEQSRSGSARPLIIEKDTIRDLSVEHSRFAEFRSSTDLAHYHRFPNGAEVYQYSSGYAWRQRGGQWLFRQVNSTGVSQTLDSITVLIPPVMIRYHPDVDSIVVQSITERSIGFFSHGVTEKYIILANQNLDIVRRDDWGDTVEFRSLPISALKTGALFAGASGSTCILVRLFQNQQNTSVCDSLRVFRVNIESMFVDSFMVKPLEPLPFDVRLLVVHDTLRLISQSRALYASVSDDGRITSSDIQRASGVSRMFGSLRLLEIHDTTTIVARAGDIRREYVIRMSKIDSDVSVDRADAVDVLLPHIFMMNVYPNPGAASATLEMRRHGSSESSATELFLVDLLGNRVRDYTALADFRFTVGTIGRATLDYTGLPAGQYLLVLRNSGVTTSKLVLISR